MSYAHVLLFLVVLVALPEDSVQWGWVRDLWDNFDDDFKTSLKDKAKSFIKKLRDVQPDEEITDDKMMEVLATRDIRDLFKEGDLTNKEKAALSALQDFARNAEYDEFADVNQPIQ